MTLCAAAVLMSAIGCKTAEYRTEELGVMVTAEENREYSYTDKKAGYWYGTTHQQQPEWWSGWNMAKKRVLADYTIGVNGDALDKIGRAHV